MQIHYKIYVLTLVRFVLRPIIVIPIRLHIAYMGYIIVEADLHCLTLYRKHVVASVTVNYITAEC